MMGRTHCKRLSLGCLIMLRPIIMAGQTPHLAAHSLLIALVDQVHHHFHHHIFFLRLALRNHQREGNEGIVGNALAPVFTVKNAVVVHKPQKQRGGNTLVTIAEAMVFGDEIE